MDARRVTIEVEEGLARVALNRPDKLNGIDLDMFDALVAVAENLSRRRDLRCVILHGNGKAFSAGVDFAAMDGSRTRVIRAFAKRLSRPDNLFQQAALCWSELPVPVIAVTHGFCFGAGLQLALGADLRFSTPDCKFSVMEAKWGLVPDMGATVTLPKLIPLDVALWLTMSAEVFTGDRAKELGLVTEVATDPLQAAHAAAEQVLARSPDAVAGAKALLRRGWNATPHAALRMERRVQRKLLTSMNHKIARMAGRGDGATPAFVNRELDW